MAPQKWDPDDTPGCLIIIGGAALCVGVSVAYGFGAGLITFGAVLIVFAFMCVYGG